MLTNKNPTIAVIDSGIGGVSILRQIINKFKAGNYIYFADNLYMPYGNKSRNKLKKRLDYIIENLFKVYHVDYIVVACNTASTILNSEPHENIFTMSFSKEHVYLATNLTKKNLSSMSVIGSRSLAKQIENNIFNEKKMDKVVKECVKKHNLNNINSLLLGCTHYELVKPLFEKYCPNTKITNNSSKLLENLNFDMKRNELNIVVCLSKQSKNLENKILSLVNKQ